MKSEALPYLCCPECRGDLSLVDDTVHDGEVTKGSLRCIACGSQWPIVDGVPDFVGDGGAAEVVQTTSGFARNWNAYNQIILSQAALNDELFRDWIEPLDPAFFKGKVVLDAGCGMGRWLAVSARYEPEALFGVDYSAVAHTAYANTRHLRNVHVLRGDLFKLPLKKAMDVTYCIGVLHHTPDPAAAFDAILSRTKDDGLLCVWVYGKENNGWITHVVSPIRKHVTSRLPDRVLSVLSTALAHPLNAAGALQEKLPKGWSLPYGAYLRYLRRYPFDYMEHIVFDHLVPELAAYIPYEEVLRWATKNDLFHHITHRNENSWRMLASRAPDTLARARGTRP
jgi:SAM-dependent methyltransferase/uncharacterized protein YbaR (Trm112 family)